MSSVSQCLDACLMTSPRCAGATTSPAPGDVIECRLYAHENQLRPTRDVTGTDLYVLHSHCYSHGEFSRAFFYMFYSVMLGFVTFCVSRRPREMYCGHARLCVCLYVCLSAAACPHYCTDPDVTWVTDRGCLLVVQCWADLQSVHRLRCNTMEMRGRAQR